MKKFVLLTVGFKQPTDEVMKSWMDWFHMLGDKVVEQVGLRNGREVKPGGVEELGMGLDSITGYLIIEAESMDEAVELAKDCPMVTSTKVYELVTGK